MSGEECSAGVVFKKDNEGIIIEKCKEERLCRQLRDRGLVNEDNYIEPLEAAYLLARRKAIIENNCGWISALEILKDQLNVILFLVYYDLRKRGRIVWRGYRYRTLLMREGQSRTIEILVLQEGSLITIEDLVEWSRLASGDGKEPVVAIVDGHGNVTYYRARAVTSLQ